MSDVIRAVGAPKAPRRLVRPSGVLVSLAIVMIVIGIVASFLTLALMFWVAALVIITLVAVSDAFQVVRAAPPKVQRFLPNALALGSPTKVRLVISSTRRIRGLVIADHVPRTLDSTGLPLEVDVEAGVDTAVAYTVTPRERGNVIFGVCECWTSSPLGFWTYRRACGEPTPVRVYPNFKASARFALLAAENQSRTTGVKQRQRRGAGLEFAELKEYVQGDLLRHIDWKATARRNKLTTRSFRDEQDQQLILLLDCGRRLRAVDDGQAHFDHALNSALLLAWVALRQGDRVGLMTFGGRDRFIAPGRGVSFFNSLLNSTYDLQTTTEASDVASALERCVERVRRRSLVVTLTNLRDDGDEELIRVMKHARARHLVVAASLREVALRTAMGTRVVDFDAAVRVASTHHYIDERERAHAALRAAGMDCLDVEPSQLPAALVNFYLSLKASGRL